MNLPFIKWKFNLSCREKDVPYLEIKERLGLQETRLWKLADLIKCPPSLRESVWQYKIERENCWLVDDSFNELSFFEQTNSFILC